jgi:hypothetical protein
VAPALSLEAILFQASSASQIIKAQQYQHSQSHMNWRWGAGWVSAVHCLFFLFYGANSAFVSSVGVFSSGDLLPHKTWNFKQTLGKIL